MTLLHSAVRDCLSSWTELDTIDVDMLPQRMASLGRTRKGYDGFGVTFVTGGIREGNCYGEDCCTLVPVPILSLILD